MVSSSAVGEACDTDCVRPAVPAMLVGYVDERRLAELASGLIFELAEALAVLVAFGAALCGIGSVSRRRGPWRMSFGMLASSHVRQLRCAKEQPRRIALAGCSMVRQKQCG